MPFLFTLPTTASFSFSAQFTSDSHPSLPLTTSTYRGVLRDALKKHKRLSPLEQSSHLVVISSSLNNYIPYLFAIDHGLSSKIVSGEEIDIVLKSTPIVEWRPTLSETALPGRENPRFRLQSLEYEIYFVLSTLAFTNTLLARASLQPLFSPASRLPSPAERTVAVTTATKHLLLAASIHNYLGTRSEQVSESPACIDITGPIFRALTSLALAEATLLAVLKDDPYPAVVAQDRNHNDREWMIKSPEIPKVRAHLFGRLCLAAAEHAANALSLLSGGAGQSRLDSSLLRYLEDLRKTGRGKACRFFGIDAELGGKTGEGIAWLQGGARELGFQMREESKKGLNIGKFKRDWAEQKEDRKVEKGSAWGLDAGRLEESRIIEALEKKWTKMNDMVNTQPIPFPGTLVATMPSGREIHSLHQFSPPTLDPSGLERMRAPPDQVDDADGSPSSDNETRDQDPVGAFPGTKRDYSESSNYY